MLVTLWNLYVSCNYEKCLNTGCRQRFDKRSCLLQGWKCIPWDYTSAKGSCNLEERTTFRNVAPSDIPSSYHFSSFQDSIFPWTSIKELRVLSLGASRAPDVFESFRTFSLIYNQAAYAARFVEYIVERARASNTMRGYTAIQKSNRRANSVNQIYD